MLLQRYLLSLDSIVRGIGFLSLVGILMTGWFSRPAKAEEAPGLRLVVLVVPGLRADDLTRPEVPALQRLLREGGIGWMDCRAGREPGFHPVRPILRPSTASFLLTLGSGAPAFVGEEAAPLITPTYHALRVSPYPPSEVVENLKDVNRRLGVAVGALGDLFHHAGFHTAVMGNLDTSLHDRSHYLVAMDSMGGVDVAGKPLLRKFLDETAPFGLRADVPMLFTYYEEARPKAALRVIAFGDLYRADRYEALSVPEIAPEHRANALKAFNTLLTGLRERLQAEQSVPPAQPVRLIVLSPGPPESYPALADRFAPIVVWGSDIVPGMLTSATTYRSGLVSNTDLVATVADWLHLSPPTNIVGHPYRITPLPALTPESLAENHNLLVREAELPDILGGSPTFGVMCALALLLLLARRFRPQIMASLAVTLVTLPLGLLLLPLFHLSSATVAGMFLAVFVLLSALPSVRLSPRRALYYYLILLGILFLLLLGALIRTPLWQEAWISSWVTQDRYRTLGLMLFLLLLGIWAGFILRTAAVRGRKQERLLPT